MSGFVGSRSKKKRRNIFLILSLIIIVCIFLLILPEFEINNNEIIPNDNIIPNPKEDLTSLASNIEDLELSVFQKDQKIKFRDGQIKNFQDELKSLKLQYEVIVLELNNSKNLSENENLVSSNNNNSLQKKITELNNKNNKGVSEIKNLNKKIDDLKSKLLLINEDKNNIIIDNQKLKKDNKNFFSKNRKLENSIFDLNLIVKSQKNEIDSQHEEIKTLKDKSHHGG